MHIGKVRWFAPLAVALILLGATASAGAQQVQPGYDTVRVASGGVAIPYVLWIQWNPLIVTTPDGGAWAFFSAEPKTLPDGTANPLATRQGRLYTARFDPKSQVWLPAQALPGGEIQFGPSAVVDKSGIVHLVYSDRAKATSDVFSTLVYTHTDAKGNWAPPVTVAVSENAGHQVAAQMAIDGNGGLHVIWQDQRAVDAKYRADANNDNNAIYADSFESDFANGKWSAPVQVDKREGPDINTNRPHLAVDGDRLVALWSVYDAKSQVDTATKAEWSSRPLNNPNGWTPQQTLWDRGGTNSVIGGRLVAVAQDPTGGVAAVYVRLTVTGRATPTGDALAKYDTYLKRLPKAAANWAADILIGTGDRGTNPAVTVGPDGTTYVAYNLGHGATVQVGAVAIAPKATKPGPEMDLTQAEEGGEGIPSLAVDAQNRAWVLYMREPPGGNANEIRCLRSAIIPAAAS